MICPPCGHQNEADVRYCARCRMSFSKTSLALSKLTDDLYWILRRANGGMLAGLIAWFFVPIVSRILAQSSTPIFINPLTGMMGGAFLGSVDGMIENSTPKTVRGVLLGGLGGAVGGLLFTLLNEHIFPQDKILWALFSYWAVAGAFIGMTSALWEGSFKKNLAGALAGAIGGGAGAFLGASVHANLVQQLSPQSWVLQRFFEALIGGFIGVTLWFFLGVTERYFVFQRRIIQKEDFKECDKCKHRNPLRSWYCGHCGRVLQVQALPTKLNLSPYATLTRVSELFGFLSRLAAATGFIAGFVSLFIFLPGNPMIVIMMLVIIAIVSYALQTLFSSLAESLEIFIKK